MFNFIRITCFLILTILLAANEICLAADEASDLSELEAANSIQLSVAAVMMAERQQFDIAGFLFFAASARKAIDTKVYPPEDEGGNSPLTALGAITVVYGKPVLKPVLHRPEALAKATELFAAWTPPICEDYDPGWKFKTPMETGEAQQRRNEIHAEVLAGMRQKLRLYSNDEYRRLAEEIDAANDISRRAQIAWSYQRSLGGATVPKQGGPITDNAPTEDERLEARRQRNVALQRQAEIAWRIDPTTRFHEKAGWKPEDYFADSNVVALCQAIEKDDLNEMTRLLESGVEVNTIGRYGMTPLLWAFPDLRLKRFRLLLEHGADPNVKIDRNIGIRAKELFLGRDRYSSRVSTASSIAITHLACISPEMDHLEYVLSHGGNPNLMYDNNGLTPLAIVVDRFEPQSTQKTRVLLNAGADPNLKGYYVFKDGYEEAFKAKRPRPLEQAVRDGLYEVATLLLQAGAVPVEDQEAGVRKIVLDLLLDEEHIPFRHAKKTEEYTRLVERLNRTGADFAVGRAYLDKSGRVWGKAKREQREQRAEEHAIETKELAAARERALRAQMNVDAQGENSLEAMVERLTPHQRARLVLPDNKTQPVFRLLKELVSNQPADSETEFTEVYADNRLEFGKIISGDRTVELAGTVERAAIVWLLHLAINEAKLLETEMTYDESANKMEEILEERGLSKVRRIKLLSDVKKTFTYEIYTANAKGMLKLPQKYIPFLSNCAKTGLGNVRSVHDFSYELRQVATLGDDAYPVLEAVNSLLAEEYPQIPKFKRRHLGTCRRKGQDYLYCTFSRKFNYAGHTETTTARYRCQNGEETVTTDSRLDRSHSVDLPKK